LIDNVEDNSNSDSEVVNGIKKSIHQFVIHFNFTVVVLAPATRQWIGGFNPVISEFQIKIMTIVMMAINGDEKKEEKKSHN